jgi:hypothetical protein
LTSFVKTLLQVQKVLLMRSGAFGWCIFKKQAENISKYELYNKAPIDYQRFKWCIVERVVRGARGAPPLILY